MSDKRTFRERASIFGRILKITIALGIIVLVVGLIFGWFTFSMHDVDTTEDDRFAIVLTVNKDAFWSSAKEANDEAVGLKDAVSEASKLQTMNGVITEIDHDGRRVTIAPEGKSSETKTVNIDEETEILAGSEKGELKSLTKGDEVSITYVEKNDVKHAKKISQL